ncbi:MAG: hypothetical protein P1R58_06865 [bacterium]|nr:hypothetical protein [bacterium]
MNRYAFICCTALLAMLLLTPCCPAQSEPEFLQDSVPLGEDSMSALKIPPDQRVDSGSVASMIRPVGRIDLLFQQLNRRVGDLVVKGRGVTRHSVPQNRVGFSAEELGSEVMFPGYYKSRDFVDPVAR